MLGKKLLEVVKANKEGFTTSAILSNRIHHPQQYLLNFPWDVWKSRKKFYIALNFASLQGPWKKRNCRGNESCSHQGELGPQMTHPEKNTIGVTSDNESEKMSLWFTEYFPQHLPWFVQPCSWNKFLLCAMWKRVSTLKTFGKTNNAIYTNNWV